MSAIEGFRVFLQVFQNIGRENRDPGIHAQSTSAEHDSYQWDDYGSVSSRLISGPSDISVDHVGPYSYFPSPLPSSRQSPSSSPPNAEEYQTECPLSSNSTDMNPSANQQTTKKQAETRIVERPDSMAQDLDLRRRSAQQARYASELEQLNANCYKTEGTEGGVIADDDSQADEDGENQEESRRVQDAFITEEEGELIEEECVYQSDVENEEDHEINDDEDADSKIDDIDNDSRDSSNDDDDDDKTEDAEPSSFILYDEDGRMKEEC